VQKEQRRRFLQEFTVARMKVWVLRANLRPSRGSTGEHLLDPAPCSGVVQAPAVHGIRPKQSTLGRAAPGAATDQPTSAFQHLTQAVCADPRQASRPAAHTAH
jgi:hypothetical protein